MFDSFSHLIYSVWCCYGADVGHTRFMHSQNVIRNPSNDKYIYSTICMYDQHQRRSKLILNILNEKLNRTHRLSCQSLFGFLNWLQAHNEIGINFIYICSYIHISLKSGIGIEPRMIVWRFTMDNEISRIVYVCVCLHSSCIKWALNSCLSHTYKMYLARFRTIFRSFFFFFSRK